MSVFVSVFVSMSMSVFVSMSMSVVVVVSVPSLSHHCAVSRSFADVWCDVVCVVVGNGSRGCVGLGGVG